mmetsp:Transcript_17279/g.30304  ORF Transcript_17279/g.30304 Transcript_17279/m.30304 type:complete len:204 (-) Transcript_17279:526-1137(-)
MSPRQQLHDGDASRPRVNDRCLTFLLTKDLWRHVLESACQLLRFFCRVCAPPEVGDPQSCIRKKEIGWLDVPVDDAHRVEVPQALHQLRCPALGICLVQTTTRACVCHLLQIALANSQPQVDEAGFFCRVQKMDDTSTAALGVFRASTQSIELSPNLIFNAAASKGRSAQDFHSVSLTCGLFSCSKNRCKCSAAENRSLLVEL